VDFIERNSIGKARHDSRPRESATRENQGSRIEKVEAATNFSAGGDVALAVAAEKAVS